MLWITEQRQGSWSGQHEGIGTEQQAELVKLYIHVRRSTGAVNTQAEELYEMARHLEDLTKDTTIRYAGLWVEAKRLMRWVSSHSLLNSAA